MVVVPETMEKRMDFLGKNSYCSVPFCYKICSFSLFLILHKVCLLTDESGCFLSFFTLDVN